MRARRLMLSLVVTAPVLIGADELVPVERVGLSAQEPPSTRAVWPERSTGADLFASRKQNPAGATKSEVPAPLEGVDPPFPFVLVEVHAEEGKVRLVGHTGAGRSLRGVFALPDGGSVLARAGESVGTEGLTVRSVELRRVQEDGERVSRARAILVREISGELVTLDAMSSPAAAAGLRAILRSTRAGATIAVGEGDRLEREGQVYVVQRIGWQPPVVEIAWTDSAGAARTVRLGKDETRGRNPP